MRLGASGAVNRTSRKKGIFRYQPKVVAKILAEYELGLAHRSSAICQRYRMCAATLSKMVRESRKVAS